MWNGRLRASINRYEEVLEAKTIEFSCFVSKGDGSVDAAGEAQTIGPLSKAQLNEALHRGFIGPRDLVWLPGMDTWKPAQVVFSGFFKSDLGKHVVNKIEGAKHRLRSHALPAAQLDFFAQLVLAVLLGILLSALDLQTFYALFFAPVFYWIVAACAFGGRSIGMLERKFCYFNRADNLPVSTFDLVARGCVSFYLVLCFGLDMMLAKKGGKLWSDKVFGLVVRQYQFSNSYFGKPVFQTPLNQAVSDGSAASEHDQTSSELTRTQLTGDTFGGYLVSKRQIFLGERVSGRAKSKSADTRAV